MNRIMKNLIILKIAILLTCAVTIMSANAQNAEDSTSNSEASLNQIMQKIERATGVQSRAAREKERQFMQQNANKRAEYDKLVQILERETIRGDQLKDKLEDNELLMDSLNKKLREELGNLSELFGHLTGAAGDLRENLDNSIISAQYPNRSGFVDKLVEDIADPSKLPEINDIHKVWFEMMRQMIESSKVVKFEGVVSTVNGENKQQTVMRIGNYNLVSNGKYLTYIPSSESGEGKMQELARQPGGLGQIKKLQNSTEGFTKVGIDPTGPFGGVFLSAIVRTPGQIEQWHQGGYVGYIITILGAFAVLLAIWRWITLSIVSGKVNRQLNNVDEPNENNPLGRLLKLNQESPNIDVESLELKINEAVIKERPPIEAWLNAIKIIASLSPLLGLLGTVTGMILTFQGIMIHGAGDVAGMADGISQALQTTKLGLFAAVPAVLMHTIVNSKAVHLVQILEEQAAGIVAERSEKNHQ